MTISLRLTLQPNSTNGPEEQFLWSAMVSFSEAKPGEVAEIRTPDEWKQITASQGLVVVDFTATWCGPCRMISPYFEELAAHPKLRHVKFAKVDVDQNANAAAEARVAAMPTFQIWKDGEKLTELVGASKERLKQIIGDCAQVDLSDVS